MASTHTTPANAPTLGDVMANLSDHPNSGFHEEQNCKHLSHTLDGIIRFEPSIPTKDAQAEEPNAALHSHQTPTPATPITPTTPPTTPPTPAAEQPTPLAENSPTTNDNEVHAQGSSSPVQNFCYCLRPEHGTMVGCDNPQCEREWFHLGCTEFRTKPLPSAAQPWLCIPCRGWQAEFEPGEPGECDAIWRCPKCGEEIVHEDDEEWLSDRTSRKPTYCQWCELEKGDRWEPENMRH